MQNTTPKAMLFLIMASIVSTCALSSVTAQTSAVAQDPSKAATEVSTQQPSWESTVVEKTSLDFGDVKIGTELEPVVLLTNRSSEPYVINSISSSCGCMKPVMAAKVIEPGTSEKMEIKLDTERFRGRRGASIHISFAKPEGREIKLAARINIQNLNCEPEELNFFSSDDANPQLQQLLVTRTGSPFWSIKSVESSTDRLTARIKSKSIDGIRVEYQIECELAPNTKPEKTVKIQRESITLITNDSNQLKKEIPIVVRNFKPIEMTPQLLDFSNVEPGAIKTVIVKLKKPSALSVKIVPEGSYRLDSQKELNKKVIKLQFSALGKGPTSAEAHLENSDGDVVTLRLMQE